MNMNVWSFNGERRYEAMAMKKTTWNIVLKVLIAMASAVLGAIGGSAMSL